MPVRTKYLLYNAIVVSKENNHFKVLQSATSSYQCLYTSLFFALPGQRPHKMQGLAYIYSQEV